ncbi:MAG: hypothetical protein ACLTA0_03300 [Streptococcus agalactiae]
MMNEGNVVADFDSDLIGDGSHANLKVVAARQGVKFKELIRVLQTMAVTVGHILQHGVF